MDPFYCFVRIILNKKMSLYCIHKQYGLNMNIIAYSFNYPICFTARSSDSIIQLLSLHSSYALLSTEHSLYLGKELYKAELSLLLEQSYIQD